VAQFVRGKPAERLEVVGVVAEKRDFVAEEGLGEGEEGDDGDDEENCRISKFEVRMKK
jgi:hypothetical protein